MTINRFKQALKEGRPQLGLWGSLASPYLAEAIATCGYDWYLIDGEHAPNDLHSVLGQLQSIAAYPTQAVVRPRIADVPLVKQFLEIGAQTLLFPMIDTADQAARAVASTRYPPQGIRGVGSSAARSSRWSSTKGYLHQANEQMCVLVQCESVTALNNLAEIAAVEGIDGVFFGPADLSASMGHLGQPEHPDVVAAITKGFATVKAAGKAPGILTTDDQWGRYYLEQGALFAALGVDLMLLMQASRGLLARFRGGEAPKAPSSYA